MRSCGTSKLVLALALGVLGAACEKPTHANIDKWRGTEKGPGKLEAAIKDKSLDADLRAHAAQALVSIGEEYADRAVAAVATIPEDQRGPIFEKLTPRLWNDAKIVQADQMPSKKQLLAKDALFALRPHAPADRRPEIDDYLVEWFCTGGHYEQMAEQGGAKGERVVRAIGVRATPKLIKVARDLYAQQQAAEEFVPVGPRLLAAIGATGSPEAVAYLLDLTEGKHKQEDLAELAFLALFNAYTAEGEHLEDRSALLPQLERLKKIAVAPVNVYPDTAVNGAYDLIALLPRETCQPALVDLTRQKDKDLRWRAVQYGIKCGGVEALIPLAEALAVDADYEDGYVAKYFVGSIEEKSLAKALEPARALLSSPSWVARMIGLEFLKAAGTKADAPLVRKLARDKTPVRGFWGDQSHVDKKQRKPDPTLGQRAVVVADLLEKKP